MPFSFKPEIESQGTQASLVAPLTISNALPSMGLMNRGGGKSSLIQVILFVILGITVLVAIGIFAYGQYLSRQIQTKKESLLKMDSEFGSLKLDEMKDLSNRMKVVNQLVSEHPSVNVAFKIIEDSVENQITYKNFALNFTSAGKGYSMTLSGSAPNYKSVVQQVETLNRKPYNGYLSAVKVTGLSPDDTGKVNFNLSMNVNIIGLTPDNLNLTTGAAAALTPAPQPVASSSPVNAATSSQAVASSTKK